MNKYQTIGSRIGALVIDSIVLLLISFATPIIDMIFTFDGFRLYITPFLTIFVLTAYFVILHARNGQTLGKFAFKVKVVNLEEEDITLQQSIMRSLPSIIQLLFLTLVLVSSKSPESQINQFFLVYGGGFYRFLFIGWSLADIIVALSNEKHRALHDYIAGTVVVKI